MATEQALRYALVTMKQGESEQTTRDHWWRRESEEATVCQRQLTVDDVCPTCGKGKLAYNGLFQLECLRCGAVADSGAFT
ncbi:MAG: hypothetical protein R3C44_20280 [Chloroflexota bacterium]